MPPHGTLRCFMFAGWCFTCWNPRGSILAWLLLTLSPTFCRSRRNKLRDKAKTLLDDECNENEENYARRLMHVEGNNVPALSGKHTGCGDYTQMWELRHAHRVHGIDPVIESPYGTSANPSGTIHLQPGTCCNSSNKGGSGGSSFTTFKPREPIYVSSRRPINVTSILRPNRDGVPFYLDVDSRPIGNEHQRSNEQDASNQSPGKRPDLLSSNRSGAGDNSTSQRRNTIPEENTYSTGNRDMCGHCALHQSADDILGEDNIPPPPWTTKTKKVPKLWMNTGKSSFCLHSATLCNCQLSNQSMFHSSNFPTYQ